MLKDVIYKKNLRNFNFFIVIMIFQCETAYHLCFEKSTSKKKMREHVLLYRNTM